MIRGLAVIAAVLLSIPLLLVAGMGIASDFPVMDATASPSPSPTATPCRVVYVADDGTESCLAIPSSGSEPYP